MTSRARDIDASSHLARRHTPRVEHGSTRLDAFVPSVAIPVSNSVSVSSRLVARAPRSGEEKALTRGGSIWFRSVRPVGSGEATEAMATATRERTMETMGIDGTRAQEGRTTTTTTTTTTTNRDDSDAAPSGRGDAGAGRKKSDGAKRKRKAGKMDDASSLFWLVEVRF